MAGLCAAQVKVIFKLPGEFGNFPCPLTYVVWFTPFQNHPVGDISMYKISPSMHSHQHHASIIPISDIVWSCHLIPGFGSGSAQLLGWTAEKVLDEAPYFYLNPYLCHHDFVLLRYSIDLYHDKLARKEHKIELGHACSIRPHRPYVYGQD